MNVLLQPCCLLLGMLSEWVRQEQEKVIEYLRTENEVLREKHGNQRILLSDNQRRRIAVKGKALGRKRLQEFAAVAQADTILRWHRELIVQNGYSNSRGKARGRPRTDEAVVGLVLRMAHENVSWGYQRIQGALDNVGHRVCSSTVANILKAHGIEPAPERRRQLSWGTFLKAHWDSFNSIDLGAIGERLLSCLRWVGELVRSEFASSHLHVRPWLPQEINRLTIVFADHLHEKQAPLSTDGVRHGTSSEGWRHKWIRPPPHRLPDVPFGDHDEGRCAA